MVLSVHLYKHAVWTRELVPRGGRLTLIGRCVKVPLFRLVVPDGSLFCLFAPSCGLEKVLFVHDEAGVHKHSFCLFDII